MNNQKIQRYLQDAIVTDALNHEKMAFISGPRQSGKSTLGRALLRSEENIFNWDRTRFRQAWAKDPELALQGRAEGARTIRRNPQRQALETETERRIRYLQEKSQNHRYRKRPTRLRSQGRRQSSW
jgi:hypothetical protein